jgi:hypothetical protein
VGEIEFESMSAADLFELFAITLRTPVGRILRDLAPTEECLMAVPCLLGEIGPVFGLREAHQSEGVVFEHFMLDRREQFLYLATRLWCGPQERFEAYASPPSDQEDDQGEEEGGQHRPRNGIDPKNAPHDSLHQGLGPSLHRHLGAVYDPLESRSRRVEFEEVGKITGEALPIP